MNQDTTNIMAIAKADAGHAVETLKALPLAALRAIHADAGCPASKSPNATFLARQAVDALRALPDAPEAPTGDQGGNGAPPEGDGEGPASDGEGTGNLVEDAMAGKVKMGKLSTEQLREVYYRVVGRATTSDDAGYLKWKIREAKKGNVTIGKLERGSAAAGSEPKDHIVLPLRLTRGEVEELDAVWKKLGFDSRMAFMRRAINEYVGLRSVEG